MKLKEDLTELDKYKAMMQLDKLCHLMPECKFCCIQELCNIILVENKQKSTLKE